MSLENFDINKISIGDIFNMLPKDEIQGGINTYLSNKGFLTQQQIDAENERQRVEKLKELEEQERKTRKKIAITLVIIVGGISALWFITQKVKK
jgi:hypothetical protein